jgi:hypothetical protein
MLKPDDGNNHEGKTDMQRYNEIWKNVITTAAGILALLALLFASKVFGGEAEKIAPSNAPSLTVPSDFSR